MRISWLEAHEVEDDPQWDIQQPLHLLDLKCLDVVARSSTASLKELVGLEDIDGHTVSRIGQRRRPIVVVDHAHSARGKVGRECMQSTVEGGRHGPAQGRWVIRPCREQVLGKFTAGKRFCPMGGFVRHSSAFENQNGWRQHLRIHIVSRDHMQVESRCDIAAVEEVALSP